MRVKAADDRTAELAMLDAHAKAAEPATRKRLDEELRIRRAGLKGEVESAYHIDFHFGTTKNWAIVHDLRLEFGGRVAQIDHLLINRWLECYVLESKHFHAGLRITEDGEFERWNNYTKAYEGMASPLLQNERHIEVLRQVVDTIELPSRLGLRMPLSFHTLIMVSPDARIVRPKKFDTSRVIKADQLKQRLWKDIDEKNGLIAVVTTAAKLVSTDTVDSVARQLVAKHRPLVLAMPAPVATPAPPLIKSVVAPSLMPGDLPSPTAITPASAPTLPSTSSVGAPSCKKCQGVAGRVLHGQYGYYFKCDTCAGNTAIRFNCQPGHKPRLRKQGEQFYRECAECGGSELFFQNQPESAS